MALSLNISGKDVYSTYGMYLEDQGANSALQWGPRKPVVFNDWYEEDGIDPDLTSPLLDRYTFQLRLAGAPSTSQLDAFVEHLKSKNKHSILITAANTTPIWLIAHAEYVGGNITNRVSGLVRIDLTFADNDPAFNYSGITPSSNIATCDDYTIDDTPFTDYGVRVLSGTLASVDRLGECKENYLYDVSDIDGVVSGVTANAHTKDYDATLRCLMRADTLEELTNNYLSLRGLFTRTSGTRYIGVKATGKKYPCYYKSQRVTRFYPDGKIWLEFDITVRIYTTAIIAQ